MVKELTPPVALRLGAWLASAPGRTWEWFPAAGEISVGLFDGRREGAPHCVGSGSGADVDAAALAALEEASGGGS